jgi:hypothetical protein
MNQVKIHFQIIAATVSTLYFGLFAYGVFFVIQDFEKIFDSFKLSYRYKVLF